MHRYSGLPPLPERLNRLAELAVDCVPVVAYGESALLRDRTDDVLEVHGRLDQLPVALPPDRVARRVALGHNAAAETVAVAEEESCDLVVMGTHGRTGLRRALLGSVAEQVLRDAACSVLVCKMPKPAGQRGE